jgi:hypothetical protein
VAAEATPTGFALREGSTSGDTHRPAVPSESLVDRRFRLLAQAGEGGFGRVYRALDTTTDREVALKILLRERTDFARFEREAEILATLSHPSIVAYIAHGLTDDGAPYLAMEWLEGLDLARRLAEGPLSLHDSLVIAARAAQGLAAVHALGIIHRDLKPGNLYLVDGRPESVRVIDFGVARAVASRMTTTGAVLGTPAYMSPEQARGIHDVSPRSDVFALGCVLFECLTGTPPFAGLNENATLAKLLTGQAPRVGERRPDTPPMIDALLSRMLARDPADRFADAGAVALTIASLLADPGATPAELLLRPPLAHQVSGAHSLLLAEDDGADLSPAVLATVISLGGELLRREPRRIAGLFVADTPAESARRAARCAVDVLARAPELRCSIRTSRGEVSTFTGGAGSWTLAGTRPGEATLDAASADWLEGAYQTAVEEERRLLKGQLVQARVGTLVGRVRELAILEGTLAEVIEERFARLLPVLGEAGVGKTRLVEELVRRIGSQTIPTAVLRANADRPTSTSPFAIVGQLVRAALGEEPASALLGLGDLDATYLRELAGAPLDEGQREVLRVARLDSMLMADAVRSAWLALVGRLLDRGPLVLVVDGLQLSDPASARLLDAALEQYRLEPLLVIGTARADEGASLLAIFRSGNPEPLVLKPLRTNAALKLVRAVNEELLPEAANEVVERAAGNPLRLAEFARLGGQATPESALAAIEARLARLDPEARRVLCAASIFGAWFTKGGVAAVLGGDDPARRQRVEVELRRCEEEHFVLPRPGVREVEGSLRSFSHALVQEAAYTLLTEDERRDAHARAGFWLETQPGADPSLIAWQFERAQETRDAFRWYEAAARVALRARDVERTRRLIDRAVACDPPSEELARVLLLRAETDFLRHQAVDGALAATRALRTTAPGSHTWVTAAGMLIGEAGERGDTAQIARLAGMLREQAPHGDAVALHAVSLCRAAAQLLRLAELGSDRALARSLTEAVTKLDLVEPLVLAWLARLHVAFDMLEQQHEIAIVGQSTAVRFFSAAGDIRGACHARIYQASLQILAADFDGASAELDVAEPMASRTGAEFLASWASYARGKILALAHDPVVAHEHLVKVRGKLAAHPRIIAGTHVYSALAALRSGNAAWAEKEARAALVTDGGLRMRAVARGALARALVAKGEPEQALAESNEALRLLIVPGELSENEPVIHLGACEAALACGRDDEARARGRVALDGLSAVARNFSTTAGRERFLYGIDTHVKTLQLAARMGIGTVDL